MFFSFDGIDGTGKSTQMEWFVQWLRQRGCSVVACRDPGGTPLGERLRKMLLDRAELPICRRAEMLLYMASRAQLVEQVIRPALQRGKTVVSDRFLLANVVYQGYGGGLDVQQLWEIGRAAVAGIHPSVVFLLDMPVEAALARLDRQPDRMEAQGREFLQRVRQGYLAEAARRSEIVVIDADREIQAVQADVRQAAERWLGSHPSR